MKRPFIILEQDTESVAIRLRVRITDKPIDITNLTLFPQLPSHRFICCLSNFHRDKCVKKLRTGKDNTGLKLTRPSRKDRYRRQSFRLFFLRPSLSLIGSRHVSH